MDVILEYLQNLLDHDWIMKNVGLYLVLMILFIETGIIIGFFLPGDPLLFISGMVIASANETPYPFHTQLINLTFWMTLFIDSTILGNIFGYNIWVKSNLEFILIGLVLIVTTPVILKLFINKNRQNYRTTHSTAISSTDK